MTKISKQIFKRKIKRENKSLNKQTEANKRIIDGNREISLNIQRDLHRRILIKEERDRKSSARRNKNNAEDKDREAILLKVDDKTIKREIRK